MNSAIVLVTGGSGFLGAAVTRALSRSGVNVRAAFRNAPESCGVECVSVGDLGSKTDWRRALERVATVVHTAGVSGNRLSQPALWRANVEGVARLVRQAEEAGVGRFILLGSIKAVCQDAEAPVSESAWPRPVDRYGHSKREAEKIVLAHASVAPVVLRLPPVFGIGARGNFQTLLHLARSGLPLPLRGVDNRRSLISVESVIAAVESVVRRQGGIPGIFHVTDRPAVSAPEIVACLREGMGKRANMLAIPMLKRVMPRALTSSLQVDDTVFRTLYGYGDRNDVDTRIELRRLGAALGLDA